MPVDTIVVAIVVASASDEKPPTMFRSKIVFLSPLLLLRTPIHICPYTISNMSFYLTYFVSTQDTDTRERCETSLGILKQLKPQLYNDALAPTAIKRFEAGLKEEIRQRQARGTLRGSSANLVPSLPDHHQPPLPDHQRKARRRNGANAMPFWRKSA